MAALVRCEPTHVGTALIDVFSVMAVVAIALAMAIVRVYVQ